MSLIGIDLGSSSVKAVAYSVEGIPLGEGKGETESIHEFDGQWEQNPEKVWDSVRSAIRELMTSEKLRKDPPTAIAVGASGRENYPADGNGCALLNNLMGGDSRGSEYETTEEGVKRPEPWEIACGHPRERQDPMFRYQWRKKNYPDKIAKTKYYPDWHGLITLKMCGRNVSDPSMLSRWAAFDLATATWTENLIDRFEFPRELLPEVLASGEPIGKISDKVAEDLGLPKGVLLVTGGSDINCCALGIGTTEEGMSCLISGTYENMLITTNGLATADILLKGLSMMYHVGSKMKRSVIAIAPTGNALLNWARETVNISINETDRALKEVMKPSPVLTLPYVSSAFMFWENGRNLRAAILGATLATKPQDIVQAFMESVAYDHVNTFSLLKSSNITVNSIRATGGGTRNEWWTQLKSDVTGVPIEVMSTDEPGTFGAALLAGKGMGIYKDVDEASVSICKVQKVYEPNPKRADMHRERMALYNRAVPALNTHVFGEWC